MPEPVAARKRALLKKQTWEEFFAKHGEKNAKPYEFRETYRENLIVFHPKFGKGYVSEVVSESKVEITFADARRILVHNRKDIPGSPVGREDDGLPFPAPTKASGKAAGNKKSAEKSPAKAVSAPKAPVEEKAPTVENASAKTDKAQAKAHEKTEEKKASAKKPDAKKADAKKAVTKKAPAPAKKPEKKPAAKKVAPKKTPAPVKKAAAKKPAAKKKHK
jgi:hypothetical protein